MKGLFFGSALFLQGVCGAAYYSQSGQDKLVYEQYFPKLQEGVFVEIGAHDGVSLSNTYFFEQLGWTGLCVEPLPDRFRELKKNRKCVCVEGCVSDRSGKGQLLMVAGPERFSEMLSGLLHKFDSRHLDRISRVIDEQGGSYQILDVDCYLLNDLLEKNGIRHINFLSLDTEGGEFDILASVDWSRYRIDVILVEDNYNDPRFIPFLQEKGFIFVKTLSQDLLFIRQAFEPGAEGALEPVEDLLSSTVSGDEVSLGKDMPCHSIFDLRFSGALGKGEGRI